MKKEKGPPLPPEAREASSIFFLLVLRAVLIDERNTRRCEDMRRYDGSDRFMSNKRNEDNRSIQKPVEPKVLLPRWDEWNLEKKSIIYQCFLFYLVLAVITKIHCSALDGFDIKTVHKLSSKEKKILVEPGFKSGAAGWEAIMPTLCYTAPNAMTESYCVCSD